MTQRQNVDCEVHQLPDDCQLVTMEEVAGYLRVHVDTVKNMLKRGDLDGYKVGQLIRVTRESVEHYLEHHKIRGNGHL